MMQSKFFDYIIVGQGIAGSVLAITLIKAGHRVCVIDKPTLSLSSKVAAGIWNPVVFKRLAKSWLADDVVPELLNFYQTFETETNSSFVYHRNILKPFTEEQEINLWQKKSVSENIFLDTTIYDKLNVSSQSELGAYSKVLQAGNIDVLVFLESTKKYILQNGNYLEESFEYAHLTTQNNNVAYNNIHANNIIFCEGHLISKNYFFNWIPLKPAKGEIITIQCAQLTLNDSILNKGLFILPITKDTYKVGATYQWDVLDDTPTEIKKQDLISKLTSLIQVPFEVINHQAGVRPSVVDRRPVIGKHPTINTLHVFNGFGTKAIMLAPYFANQFLNHLTSNTPLLEEANVCRFYKLNNTKD